MKSSPTKWNVVRAGLCSVWLVLMVACAAPEMDEHESEESWAVTAWGDLYEIFAEADGLVVGVPVKSYTHVTVLGDFSPLRQGEVSIVLSDREGREAVFTGTEPIRDGIYSIEIDVESAGEYELSYRVKAPAGVELIPAGRVQVAAAEAAPGGLLEAKPAAARASDVAGSDPPISFLKEQQWKTAFATEWVHESALSESLRVPGRVRPVAGGEVLITAPVDGVLAGSRWPYVGLSVATGETLFRIAPRIGAARSLAELSGEASAVEAELAAARQRAVRLAALVESGAASEAELERAHSEETALAARSEAAQRDLSTARAVRRGESAGEAAIPVTAPFAGRIAEVASTPGEAVAAGQAVVRLVRAEPVWIEVALTGDEVDRLPQQPAGLRIEGHDFGPGQVRLVSIAPGVDPETGTIRALFEVATSVEKLRLGTVGRVEILLDSESDGVVVPASAVVDDAGVRVMYLQIDGEGFARAEVKVVARSSDRLMVEGLPPGARIVTVGGDAIRRATLVATDAGEGHIH